MDEQIKIFKSLGDETRLSLVRRIAELGGQALVRDILPECTEALSLSQPTLSHHFSKLVAAGVLGETKVGVEKVYHLNRRALRRAGIKIERII